MKKIHTYTLGADPEMFVRSIGGDIVPVCGTVGGTKARPMPFSEALTRTLKDGTKVPRTIQSQYAFQEDGVAFEFNIRPALDYGQFEENINYTLGLSNEVLGRAKLTYDTTLSSHRFSEQSLQHPGAMTIGCDPDFCAYGPNYKPIEREPFGIKDLGLWRHTGGHLHFGYNKELIPDYAFIQLVDALVYLPVLTKDKQRGRRKLYGLAGLYRPKPYGVEYRTPSNFWLNDIRLVSAPSFNLLFDVHVRTDEINSAYMQLPIDDIKACIDAGGNDDTTRLIKTVKEICAANHLECVNNFQSKKAHYLQTWAQG